MTGPQWALKFGASGTSSRWPEGRLVARGQAAEMYSTGWSWCTCACLCYIVTSTHTCWWRTIKEVEPTGEGTHNPEHNLSSGSPQIHLQPYHPTLQRLHHGLWVLPGVQVLEITTTMHTCHAYMHNEHALQHTPGYAGIPMPLLKLSIHALAQHT